MPILGCAQCWGTYLDGACGAVAGACGAVSGAVPELPRQVRSIIETAVMTYIEIRN